MSEKTKSLLSRINHYDFELSWKLALMCKLDKETILFKILDKILYLFEILGSGVPSLTFCILMMPFCTDWYWFFLNISIAHLVDVFCQFSAKNFFKRPRPQYQDNEDMFFTHGPDKYSFPSGHCTRMSMFWYLTMCLLDKNVYAVYYSAAVLFYSVVIASRVLMGRHYVSDLIGGSILGMTEGYIIWEMIWFHWRLTLHCNCSLVKWWSVFLADYWDQPKSCFFKWYKNCLLCVCVFNGLYQVQC